MLSYRQIAGIKLGTLSFALLVAHYWPSVAEWTTLWWIILVLSVIYVFSFWFKK